MVANWVIGVLLASLASVISNLGLNLQKLQHTLNEQRIRKQLREERRARTDGAATTAATSDVASNSHRQQDGETELSSSCHGSGNSNVILNMPTSSPSQSYQNESPSDALTDSQQQAQSFFADDNTDEPSRLAAAALGGPTSFSFAGKPAYPSAVPPNQQQQSTISIAASQPTVDAYELLGRVEYTKQPMWRSGLALVSLGSLMDFVALMFAAQSIIGCLGSLTLVANTLFAPLLLGESVSQRDLLATFTIVLGSAIAVASADHEDAVYTVDVLFSFFTTTRFILYALFMAMAISGLFWLKRTLTRIRQRQPRRYIEEGLTRYHRFTYAALAGITGAQCVLFAKCVGAMLVSSLSGADDFLLSYWQTYFIFAGLVTSIYFQISWLNSGLRNFDALTVIPIFQSFWLVVSVSSGLIFFGEYARVFDDPVSAFFFPLGVGLTVAGVYVLSKRGSGKDAHGGVKDTPLQRNYKHYVRRDGTVPSPSPIDFGSFQSQGAASASSGPPLSQSEEDDLLFTSPAPPLGFLSTWAAAPSWHHSHGHETSFVDVEDLEPLDEYEYVTDAAAEEGALNPHRDRSYSSSSSGRQQQQQQQHDDIDEADIVEDGLSISMSPPRR